MENTQEEKIKYYLKIAFEQGIEKAIKEIKNNEEAFMVDAFHDKLVEKINENKNLAKGI
jgi:hypothetical protein